MPIKPEYDNQILRAWFLCHRTCDTLARCENRIFAEYNITNEQYAVLSAMKALGDPVRSIDLARAIERSPHSISMIIDRMVTAGLVRRVRDLNDRRAVRLVITNKGENALKPSTLAGWKFIQEIMSVLSHKDLHTLVRLFEIIKKSALQYLEPGVNIEETRSSDITNKLDLMNQLCQYISSSTTEAKPQDNENLKTT